MMHITEQKTPPDPRQLWARPAERWLWRERIRTYHRQNMNMRYHVMWRDRR
jgi:hypothetical protein